MADRYELFPSSHTVGVFRGFREGGLEFHADLTLPYRTDLHNIPMHGQFLLVQLETPDEAVLGRITSLSSDGRLAGGSGEEFNIRAMREGRSVPEQLREDYLKYRVDIRVLGVLRRGNGGSTLTFVASHRRLPHVGSPVAFLNNELLQWVAGAKEDGAEIGHLALGEYVYAAGDHRLPVQDWMQVKEPRVVVKFPVANLVSRRSFVFARAGFGKSNLNKLLFSKLYESQPTVTKRGDRKVPVGTLIFDPDGEYFWPDDKGRPGLCDVPGFEDKVVVFTSRDAPSPLYGAFVAGGIKLDLRLLKPGDVIAIALSPEKQDQQNVAKLRALDSTRWSQLVDLIYEKGNSADDAEVSSLLHMQNGDGDVEVRAARSNMTRIVKMLHDPSSRLMDMLLESLEAGKLCIVDVSQLRGGPSLILSGLILRRIFDRNQEEFTKALPRTIPVIAVVEEAQSVLNDKASAAAPYIEWVKEGRKYDLGALLITQQPGSIPVEILSQGDNWFIFHLLSTADLGSVRGANAHFSQDLLSALLNEPIQGQGVFWSSVSGKPYPIPLRVLSFEAMFSARDPKYEKQAVATYAKEMRARYGKAVAALLSNRTPTGPDLVEGPTDGLWEEAAGKPTDVLALVKQQAFTALASNQEFTDRVRGDGIKWGRVKFLLLDTIPPDHRDRDDLAYSWVKEGVTHVLGEFGHGWKSEKRNGVAYIVAIGDQPKQA